MIVIKTEEGLILVDATPKNVPLIFNASSEWNLGIFLIFALCICQIVLINIDIKKERSDKKMIAREMRHLAKIEAKASSKPIDDQGITGAEKEGENADEIDSDLSDENSDLEREKQKKPFSCKSCCLHIVLFRFMAGCSLWHGI